MKCIDKDFSFLECITENRQSSWCQLCRHRRLPWRQRAQPTAGVLHSKLVLNIFSHFILQCIFKQFPWYYNDPKILNRQSTLNLYFVPFVINIFLHKYDLTSFFAVCMKISSRSAQAKYEIKKNPSTWAKLQYHPTLQHGVRYWPDRSVVHRTILTTHIWHSIIEIYRYSCKPSQVPRDSDGRGLRTMLHQPIFIFRQPGPRLNINTVFTMYGDSHVKDKQRVLMHRHQGWNVRHGLCHIYMRYIYIWVVYSFCSFCCLFIIVTWWYIWCIVWQVASKRKYRHVW